MLSARDVIKDRINALLEAGELAPEGVRKDSITTVLRMAYARIESLEKQLSEKKTLRDELAQGALHAVYAECCQEMDRNGCPDENWRIEVALDAYKMADAMLIVRSL